jgi:outer membrane receptor for ferrienterochelin and colicins
MVLNEDDIQVRENQLFAPLFSGVFNVSYEFKKQKMAINYTGRIVGPQHLPEFDEPFARPTMSPWFTQQHIQFSKTFNKGLEVYFGVKNIFNYTQPTPLVNPQSPFSDEFDTSYAYGPLQTRRFYFGFRYKLPRK